MIKITREQLLEEAECHGQEFIDKNCPYTHEHTPEEKILLDGVRETIKQAFVSGWLQSAHSLLEMLQKRYKERQDERG